MIGSVDRLKRFLLLTALLALCGCAQTMTSSSVTVDAAYLTEETEATLVAAVYAKAEALSGTCKLVNAERRYHSCSVGEVSGNPSFEMNVGYGQNGEFGVSLTTVLVHWFPPPKVDVISGAFLSERHKRLEDWMLSLVPEEAAVNAVRHYIGYDHSEEF